MCNATAYWPHFQEFMCKNVDSKRAISYRFCFLVKNKKTRCGCAPGCLAPVTQGWPIVGMGPKGATDHSHRSLCVIDVDRPWSRGRFRLCVPTECVRNERTRSVAVCQSPVGNTNRPCVRCFLCARVRHRRVCHRQVYTICGNANFSCGVPRVRDLTVAV